jgi:hypothetical protein
MEAEGFADEDALWAADCGETSVADVMAKAVPVAVERWAPTSSVGTDDEAWAEAAAAAAAECGEGRGGVTAWRASVGSGVGLDEGRGKVGGDAIVDKRRALRAVMAEISLP